VECRRHVAIGERACPFCRAELEVASPREGKLGRVSRAAVFAGAALATTACGGKKKADTLDNTQQQTATADAGVEQAPPPPPDNSNVPMPYGAPPARRRVV
jgi:hypothetical protein